MNPLVTICEPYAVSNLNSSLKFMSVNVSFLTSAKIRERMMYLNSTFAADEPEQAFLNVASSGPYVIVVSLYAFQCKSTAKTASS